LPGLVFVTRGKDNLLGIAVCSFGSSPFGLSRRVLARGV
jgi:hypothetical protein